jgi:hypothetical protein
MVEHQQAPPASLQGLGAQPSIHDSIYDFPWYNFFALNELEVSIDALNNSQHTKRPLEGSRGSLIN